MNGLDGALGSEPPRSPPIRKVRTAVITLLPGGYAVTGVPLALRGVVQPVSGWGRAPSREKRGGKRGTRMGGRRRLDLRNKKVYFLNVRIHSYVYMECIGLLCS
jgi:hypothetical protein